MRHLHRIRQRFWLFLFAAVSLSALSGCVGIGNEVRLRPIPDGKWQHDPGNYGRDDTVIFQCEETSVEVREVRIKGRLYAVGIILPVIPMPFGYDETRKHPNLEVDITLRNGSGTTELKKNDVSICVDNTTVTPDWIDHEHVDGEKFRIRFDFLRAAVKSFTLHFHESLASCRIPPVVYELNDRIRLYLAAQ